MNENNHGDANGQAGSKNLAGSSLPPQPTADYARKATAVGPQAQSVARPDHSEIESIASLTEEENGLDHGINGSSHFAPNTKTNEYGGGPGDKSEELNIFRGDWPDKSGSAEPRLLVKQMTSFVAPIYAWRNKVAVKKQEQYQMPDLALNEDQNFT